MSSSELRLPGIKLIWTALAETADKEGWPAARFLAALAEQEMVERSRRRFERHLEKGWRVLFTRTTDLVQKLQIARRDLALEAAIAKLDKYHLLILDDLAYVTKDQAETSVLFELISARYERRSLLITANQPFGEWGKVFSDQAMTLAAVDRLVHHATIFEMNVESYRRRAAIQRKQVGAGRPAIHATRKNVGVPATRDNQPERALANDSP